MCRFGGHNCILVRRKVGTLQLWTKCRLWIVCNLVAIEVKYEFREFAMLLESVRSIPSIVILSICVFLFLDGRTFFINFQNTFGSRALSAP